MNRSEAQEFIDNFLSSPSTQQWVADALDYCAQLSAAVAETHGFHDDEREVKQHLRTGIAKQVHEADMAESKADELLSWFDAQLLQAEQARIMSETAEGVENVRKGCGPDDKCSQFPGWTVEAIDDIVRNLDMLGKRGISPGEIFVAKTLVNNSRSYKHGKNS